MKTISKIKNQVWKKLTALGVVGSLLFSFIPPYIHAAHDLSKPESYKLRKQVLTSNFERTEDRVVRFAQSRVPAEQLPGVLREYQAGLKRTGIKRVVNRIPRGSSAGMKRVGANSPRDFSSGSRSNITGANSSRVSGTQFKISTLRSSVTHLTALHVGTFLMHIRKLHENYSVLNIPHSFAYFFRAVLDGNKDQNHRTMSRYTVSPAKADSKWEYNTKMFIDEVYLREKFWERVMKVYYEQWEVLVEDWYDMDYSSGKGVKKGIKLKAERTIGDYLVKPITDEERHFISVFRSVYKDLINDEYDYMGTDEVFVNLYDGPGFIWDEDVFQLAYYYIDVDKLDDFTKQYAREDRKDENYYREGNFLIDRRYARILIEYGKKHGEEALSELMRTHAERELLAQTRVNRGGQHANYDKIHDELLEEPGQKELMEFATRAANDIRLGDFPDYLLVRDILDNLVKNPNQRVFVMPENRVGGLYGDYLMRLYMTIKRKESHTPQYGKAIKEIFLLIRRDQELYLEFKAEMERSLGEEEDQRKINELRLKENKELYLEFKRNEKKMVSKKRGEEEINAYRVMLEFEALRKRYMERLAEREREKVFYGFSVGHPRFVRIFGREMIIENLDALLKYEKRVEEYWVKKGWRQGELSYGIFAELFRELKEIVTSKNLMVIAEDIFHIIQMHESAGFRRHISITRDRLDNLMEYLGPNRGFRVFHFLVEFYYRIPLGPFRYNLFEWRVRIEEYLRWLHPDTYERIKKQKEEDSKKHWMQRTRENMETWYGWILFFVTLSAGSAFAYDGSSALTIWNEISHSVSSLLPYLTVGLVSVALGTPFERGVQQPQKRNNLTSPNNDVQEAIADIANKTEDSEDIVRAILTPTLYQALSGIVQENPIRVFLNRADLKRQIKDIQRLIAQNEGEKRIEPVITINRKFKDIENVQVKIELRNHGIDPNKVKIIDQPMTEDGKFSLKALLKEYPELLEGGYSLWVLNTESWIELIYEAINPMELEGGIALVELDLKAELVTETAQ